MAPWILSTVVVGGCVYLFWQHGSPALFVVLVLLFASDCWRSANLSLLGAARRQQRYGSWMASDAWSRPLAASLVVALLGESPELVLASYLIVSVCLNILFSPRVVASVMVTRRRLRRNVLAKSWEAANVGLRLCH